MTSFFQDAFRFAPVARFGLGVPLNEEFDDALNAVNVRLARGPRSGPSFLERCRVFAARDLANGFPCPSAGRCEVDRGIAAERQLLGRAVEAVSNGP